MLAAKAFLPGASFGCAIGFLFKKSPKEKLLFGGFSIPRSIYFNQNSRQVGDSRLRAVGQAAQKQESSAHFETPAPIGTLERPATAMTCSSTRRAIGS